MQIRHAKSSHRHEVGLKMWFFKRKIFYSKFIRRDLLLLFLAGAWWHYLSSLSSSTVFNCSFVLPHSHHRPGDAHSLSHYKMPMRPIKFCCCLLFYVHSTLVSRSVFFFLQNFLFCVFYVKPSAKGIATSNVYH